MRTLSIDLETFSSTDIKTCGAYAYVDALDFEILLFAYAFDDEPAQIIDLMNGEAVPRNIIEALQDLNIIKTAYNANFERTCLVKYYGCMPPEQWRCTQVHASMLGLPGHLAEVARVLNLAEDKQKMTEGKALIKYFCCPCKPTKKNMGRTRNLPEHDPVKWQTFKDYCIRDVEVEREIRRKIEKFIIPDFEQKLWELDQRINDNGVKIDIELASQAIECDLNYKNRMTEEAVKLTGLDNPNSVAQLKAWFEEYEGVTVESLNKGSMPGLAKEVESETGKRLLELRQEMSKTSVKKYDAMQRAVCSDGRVKGLLQFYGANRTGRWAGRIVQVQNLPQNKLKDLKLARDLVISGQHELLELLFESVPNTLSQLIRTAFIPSTGRKFIVADFSAIEARVIAWLAGEQWRLDVFNTHGKIYEASAAQMFKVPISSIGKGSPLRQKGKVAELALGYQGGKGALVKMGALEMGLEENELQGLVDSWREANPNIVKFWNVVGNAALKAVREKTTVAIYRIIFSYESGILFIRLPSGRRLAYVRPKLEKGKFGDVLTYEGIDQTKKIWTKLDTYGGKLAENIVQAVARDCLAESMIRLDGAGYPIVMHVHDENIIDAAETDDLENVCEIMGQDISWAVGLPLAADGYETEFYRKD